MVQSNEDKVIAACRDIEQAETMPSLALLAERAGMSASHFQRLFKKVVGVTPKQYGARNQAGRFSEKLVAGETVTNAMFDAGYSSSSRAHEGAARLGMKPSKLRKGAAGEVIRYAIAHCYLGHVIVAVTDRGVCAVEFDDDPKKLPGFVQARFPKAQLKEVGDDFPALVKDVVDLLETPERAHQSGLPLDIRGTAFQEQVWDALRMIRPGTTVSYTELAQSLGRPKSVRAVANACANNKLGVLVPCHRVVRSDGSLAGYRWGLERKRALLEREAGGT